MGKVWLKWKSFLCHGATVSTNALQIKCSSDSILVVFWTQFSLTYSEAYFANQSAGFLPPLYHSFNPLVLNLCLWTLKYSLSGYLPYESWFTIHNAFLLLTFFWLFIRSPYLGSLTGSWVKYAPATVLDIIINIISLSQK